MGKQVTSSNTEDSLEAIEALKRIAKDFRLAAAVYCHSQTICITLEKKTCQDIHSEVLNLLCKLSLQGQAETLALNACYFSQRLADGDMVIARKAATLCRRIADEGCASYLLRYIPQLVECCDQYKHKTAAPFEALTAIADAGEGMAVAATVPRLHVMLLAKPRTRGAICNTLISILRGGGGVI